MRPQVTSQFARLNQTYLHVRDMRIFLPGNQCTLMSIIDSKETFPFDLQRDKWEYVSDPVHADILPVMVHHTVDDIIRELRPIYQGQTIAVLQTYHMQDDQDTEKSTDHLIKQFSSLTNRVTIIHQNQRNLNPSSIFYDMMWNRQKAYFIDNMINLLDTDLRAIWFFHATEGSYRLNPLVKHREKCVHYLSPSRIHYANSIECRHLARTRLSDVLVSYHGWYSDWLTGKTLEPEDSTLTGTVPNTDIMLQTNGGWLPVANHYYETSYVSMYVETVTNGELSACITEKTYDPLIKGHFILPFGYSGLIRDIRCRGFWLPDWIDYSYDNIPDWHTRLTAYLESVRKVCEMDLDHLHALWIASVSSLESNRTLFKIRDYHDLHGQLRTQRAQHVTYI
jgi:hypothetical protein